MKFKTIVATWIGAILIGAVGLVSYNIPTTTADTTRPVAVATEPDPAIANRHRAAEQLAYQVQAIRDRIGIQCRRLGWPRADDCEMANYTSYYKILDGIKRAEISADALIAVSQIIGQLEVKIDPNLKDLEHSMPR